MSLSDPIGDMIARVKNAQARNHKKVDLPSSNFKSKIADILKNEGFIKDFKISSEDNKPTLSLELKYHSGNPVISAFERVSKPGRRIFSRLTVEENLRLGAHANEKGKFFETDIKEVYDLFPVLSDRKTQRGGTLSGGEQQMLAIGRALMSKPKVLLLDEPSLGIAPKLVNQIFISIKNINKEKNVTIFLVEQNAKKALELADRAYVLVNGKVTIKGSGQELLKNKDIQAAYLEGGAKN